MTIKQHCFVFYTHLKKPLLGKFCLFVGRKMFSATPRIRAATHAGSWYSGSHTKLNTQLDEFLKKAPLSQVTGARVLVGPHAGYSYAGETLAQTYKAFDPTNIKRVFILGPSHHVYFKGSVMTTNCSSYETPLGDIPIDTETINELVSKDSKLFKLMPLSMDEEEHSFEMHMPFLYKVTKDLPQGIPKVIPIMVSSTDEALENRIANYLKPYFESSENAFVISTDFCHWGSRFGYRIYTSDGNTANLVNLKSGSSIFKENGNQPIYKSIESLDKKGMEAASTGSYKKFKQYMKLTENTICGAKPLSILLATMEDYYEDEVNGRFKWIGYTQSSHCFTVNDSSVSYASGYAVL